MSTQGNARHPLMNASLRQYPPKGRLSGVGLGWYLGVEDNWSAVAAVLLVREMLGKVIPIVVTE